MAEQGVDLIERPRIHGGGDKNGADIQLAVDALETCLTRDYLDLFAIVSGDSDFLPLISKLQSNNRQVVVISKRANTSESVKRNCNEFVAYENLERRPKTSHGKKTPPKSRARSEKTPTKPQSPTSAPPKDHSEPSSNADTGDTHEISGLPEAFALLCRAVSRLEDEGQVVLSSVVKQKMLQIDPAFDEMSFGFSQFKLFLQEAQKRKLIRLGKKLKGNYPVSLGSQA